MNPIISVVVPVFNLKRFLTRCMDSLLTQTIDNYEIILIDDGSTDGSEVLCEQYANEYADFVHCIHKKNGGLSSARNQGIDVAKGEYIIFPDPDDWVDSDYLEKLIELQMTYSVDLVCTGYYVEFDHYRIPANQGQQFNILFEDNILKSLFFSPSMGGFAWNKLYHLSLIRKEKLYFLEDVGTTEDLDFTFRYLRYCTKICFSPEIRTYHYYQRKDAATHGRFSPKKVESIHTYEKILQTVDKNSEIALAAKEEICNLAINLIPMYLDSKGENEIFYNQIRGYINKYYVDYLKSKRYGFGRKMQAILARYTPILYWKMKKLL